MGVVIGEHVIDHQDSRRGARGQLRQRRWRRPAVPRLGNKRRPIAQGPAVILHVSDFEPIGAERYGEFDHLAEAVEVLPVNDGVDGQRQPGLADEARCPPLCLLRPGEPGDAVAGHPVGILKTELDVLEPGLDQLRQPTGIETNAGRDQIAVEPDFGRMAHELGEVAPNERLTAGEVHLQNAERRGFAEHSLPAFGIEFGAGTR